MFQVVLTSALREFYGFFKCTLKEVKEVSRMFCVFQQNLKGVGKSFKGVLRFIEEGIFLGVS